VSHLVGFERLRKGDAESEERRLWVASCLFSNPIVVAIDVENDDDDPEGYPKPPRNVFYNILQKKKRKKRPTLVLAISSTY
jgi:hypothetical protein